MIAGPRWPLARVCVLAFALIAVACSRGKDRAYSRGSSVIVAYCCGGEVMTPWMSEEASMLVFLPLVTDNEQGEDEGRLARWWGHSVDYREWTYHLRTDVRWHDGVPVTAHDVKFSFELLAHPDVADIAPGTIESITVPDDSTVVIRYSKPADLERWRGA